MKRLLLVGPDVVHTYNYLELVKNDFEEILLVSNRKREGSDVRTELVDFNLKNPLQFLTAVRRFRKILNDFQPSVVHAHQANAFSFLPAYAMKESPIPLVVSIWGSDVLLVPQMGFMYRWMVKYVLNHADYFMADADFLIDKAKSLMKQPKADRFLNVILGGIDLPQATLAKENLIYSNRAHNSLYRIDKIIKAFKEVNGDWKLVVAGQGTETEQLKKLSAALSLNDRIDFVGHLSKEENISYYQKAKVFASVPESDGTSVSLLEAMANGCVPVLSDLPANKEWIKDGENGVIVRDLESDFLNTGIQLDQVEVSALNQQIIQEKGTKEVNRNKVLDFYKKILS